MGVPLRCYFHSSIFSYRLIWTLFLSKTKLLFRVDLESLLTTVLRVKLIQNNFLKRICVLNVDMPTAHPDGFIEILSLHKRIITLTPPWLFLRNMALNSHGYIEELYFWHLPGVKSQINVSQDSLLRIAMLTDFQGHSLACLYNWFC